MTAPGARARFADENDSRVVVSMANNGGQFVITFAPTLWLDKKHIAFGKVIDVIQQTGTASGTPTKVVNIMECGKVRGSNRSTAIEKSRYRST
jgi:cyclophilin family peptidyl-prolyl cis-trans isomerase